MPSLSLIEEPRFVDLHEHLKARAESETTIANGFRYLYLITELDFWHIRNDKMQNSRPSS